MAILVENVEICSNIIRTNSLFQSKSELDTSNWITAAKIKRKLTNCNQEEKNQDNIGENVVPPRAND